VIKGLPAITARLLEFKSPTERGARSLLHYLIWTGRNKTIQVAFPYSNQLWGAPRSGFASWARSRWARPESQRRRSAYWANADRCAWYNGPAFPKCNINGRTERQSVHLSGMLRNSAHKVRFRRVKAVSELRLRLWPESRETNSCGTAIHRCGAEEICAPAAPYLRSLASMKACLGAFLQLLEFQTATSGELLNVNALRSGKGSSSGRNSHGLMGRSGCEGIRIAFPD